MVVWDEFKFCLVMDQSVQSLSRVQLFVTP